MLKTILLIVTLFTLVTANSQTCNYTVNDKDEFTGSYHRVTEEHFPHGKIEFSKQDGKYTIKIYYSNPNINTKLSAKAGDELLFKLKDGSMITLFVLETSPSNKKKPTLYDSPVYEISESDLIKIGTSTIIMARIDFNGEKTDINPKKYAEKIVIAANCILK